jgi:sirohydrochlorin cobaltochelatase
MDVWRDAALLLVGHGSSRQRASRAATTCVADDIRRRGLFAEVVECFWKEPPFLALDLVAAPRVYVVPNFAGEGLFTRHLIPERLGLAGRRTRLPGREVIYTEPVGCHPGVASLLRRRAEALCAAHAVDPAAVALLLIGHGSSRPGGSTTTPEAVATAIRAAGRFGEVAALFIEQAPRVAEWPRLVAAANIIAAPLLISEGMHVRGDLPPLFGLDRPEQGPGRVAGRRTWLTGGIARFPEVADMVLDQVRAAEAAPGQYLGHQGLLGVNHRSSGLISTPG